MIKQLQFFTLGVLIAFAEAAPCGAQNTYGYSEIYYDSARNVMVAYGGTDPDYLSSYYYRAVIETEVVLNNAMYSYRQWASDPYQAQLYFEFPAGPGQEWNMQSYHSVEVVYYTYQVSPGCSWDCYNWWDGYGYGALPPTQCRVTTIPGGWRIDCDYDDRYWYPPLVYVATAVATVALGNTSKSATTPGTNVPEFRVSADAFIPFPTVEGPPWDYCSGAYGIRKLYYHGDNRGYQANSSTWRTYTWGQAAPALGILRQSNVGVGNTISFADDALYGANGDIYPYAWDWIFNDCHYMHGWGTASTANMHIGSFRTGINQLQMSMWGSADNPLVASLAIDWNFIIDLTATVPTNPLFTIRFEHDCFPAHEVYINTQQIHGYMPTQRDFLTLSTCLGGAGKITGQRTDRIY